MQDEVGLLSRDMEDSGEWIDHGPFSEVIEPVLWCMLNEMDVTFDPTITTDKALELSQPGLRVVKVDNLWTCTVNWTREWVDGLPPYHVGAVYKDVDVGVLSVLLNVRTCPICKVGGYHVTSAEHALRTGRGRKQVPRCVPTEWFVTNGKPVRPCPGRPRAVVDGKVLSWQECGGFDWYAHEKGLQVTMWKLQDAAAARAADNDGDSDHLYGEMSAEDNPPS